MKNKPNIILIITDQQRYDTVSEFGFPWMITPALDRLAREGAFYTDCFCAAPSCVPSRYSFFNGKYPHADHVYTNGFRWEHSWVENLRDAGYTTANTGKMHTVPYTTPCGFQQRFVVENKDRPRSKHEKQRFYDEWDKFLLNSGMEKPGRDSYKQNYPGYENALGAYEWPLEEKYHSDEFTGNMALWFINNYSSDEPLFLQIGFPGPHPPYDPSLQYIKQYENAEIPLPVTDDLMYSGQPPFHKTYRNEMLHGNHDGIKWKENPTPDELLRLRKYYAANVTMIDKKIGEIMKALDKKGLLDNSIVIFTSDHGDSMGDHGHIEKWTMYDENTRVPMIIWSKDRVKPGTVHTEPTQQMDIANFILREAGVAIPADWDAVETRPGDKTGREYIFAEHLKDNVCHGAEFWTMVRSKHHKLVYYAGEPYGELYDLEKDPGEMRNEWDNPGFITIKEKLKSELLEFRMNQSKKYCNR